MKDINLRKRNFFKKFLLKRREWFLFFSFLTCFLVPFTLRSGNNFVRTDFRDETIYFVITTRFYDGDPSNNVQCWDGQSLNQGDPAWRGDFKGLIEKLDYIKALGFTAIWITPVVENASGYDYHGYHAFNFKKVDPRYESTDVNFQTLINAVHAKGMKIILDIVLNHTGNFGEATLCPMFEKDYSADLSDINASMKRIKNGILPDNYENLLPGDQYQARLARMKNTDGQNHDVNNYWHHFGNFNWDDITCQWAQIAGDCVDLNTENPLVYNYLIDAYGQFIRMGVDGFRIDTGRHINRLVFNKVFIPAFQRIANECGNDNFFIFSEICTRDRNYWYRNTAAMSTPFYTWKDSRNYDWTEDASYFQTTWIKGTSDEFLNNTNQRSCVQNYNDNVDTSIQPSSNNAFLNGNDYHTPDHSMHSGMNVIDFPMHWNFESAKSAFRIACEGDHAYNDPTYNVVYVDSHDYAPDGAPESQRFAKPQDVWAENLCLMYTFRGIPCVYYGSEIEFKKGCPIDKGPTIPLKESGRAYYGGYISGTLNVNDFASYSNATGNVAVTLKHPLARHIQRLSQIRMAIPALRKGEYSTEGQQNNLAFKRRYVDATTDSYVCVAISESFTFNNVLNGTYVDAITGDTKVVTNNKLTVNVPSKGNMRVYVLNTEKTPAPGKIGVDGKYLYDAAPVIEDQGTYPDETEPLIEENTEPVVPQEPVLMEGEEAIFFEKPSNWGSNINVYIYYESNGNVIMITKAWPGDAATKLGNNVYKFNFEGEITNWKVLFNDGTGNQAPGGGQPGFVVVNGGYYKVTGLDHIVSISSALPTIANELPLKFYSKDNTLYIYSAVEGDFLLFGINGVVIRHLDIKQGENVFYGIPKGVYLINHQKVVIY